MFQCEQDEAKHKEKLRAFIEANYRNYYGRLIFVPTQPNHELAELANRMWLIKNGITL